jgi:hypothetical protein
MYLTMVFHVIPWDKKRQGRKISYHIVNYVCTFTDWRGSEKQQIDCLKLSSRLYHISFLKKLEHLWKIQPVITIAGWGQPSLFNFNFTVMRDARSMIGFNQVNLATVTSSALYRVTRLEQRSRGMQSGHPTLSSLTHSVFLIGFHQRVMRK